MRSLKGTGMRKVGLMSCAVGMLISQAGFAQTQQDPKKPEPASAMSVTDKPAPSGPAGKTASANSASTTGGFPSKAEARKEWHANDPAPKKPGQPAFDPMVKRTPTASANSKNNTVSAAPLESPKIDYPKEALDRVLPMDPPEIRTFTDKVYDRSTEMTRVPGGHYISLPSRIVRATIDPGRPVERIAVAMGKGVMVAFIDRNGAPMIVESTEGFSKAINVRVMATERAVSEGTNSFSIEALSLTGEARVFVQLKGVHTPYAFDVDIGKTPNVDSLVSFAMPMLSSKKVIHGGDRMEADAGIDKPEMWGFLSGVAPEGAVEVEVPNVPGSKAWVYAASLYLRTPYIVMTPAYFDRRASSDGGTIVYRLPPTSIVRLGVEGREVQVLLNYPYMPAASRASFGK